MTDDVTGTDPTRSTGGRSWRIPMLVGAAVLAIVVVVAIAVGADNDDDGTDLSADPTTSSSTPTATSPSASDSPTASDSASESASPSNGDPTPSPVINKAVKAAMEDGFPALVPSGVPAGWTVVGAKYNSAAGGSWGFAMTTPDRASVFLVQSTASIEDLLVQYLGADAHETGKVDLKDFGTGIWTAYTSRTKAGIAKKISDTSALVYGSDQSSVVTLAQELLTAEDADLPEAG
jgi:Protein of unknown function (DUF4245)